MSRKIGKVLICVLLLMAVVIAFSSCSIEQSLEYNNNIESRYGDGFSIVKTYDAPNSATELDNVDRVKKEIVIDNRIPGLHLTGLYIAKGETITVTIPSNQIEAGHYIRINPQNNIASELYKKSLDSTKTTVTSNFGGIVEFYNNSSATNEINTYTITIDGAVEGSYYRYGIDDYDQSISKVGNYITLDATNVRLYIPTTYYSSIENPKACMNWWRNSMLFMDELLDLSLFEGDYSPLKIFATNDVGYSTEDNYLYVTLSQISDMVSYDSVSSGKSLEIIRAIAKLKVEKTNKFIGTIFENNIVDIITAITYANMCDSYQIEDDYIVSASKCMELAINGIFVNDLQRTTSLIMNLYYKYGQTNVLKILNNVVEKHCNTELDFIKETSVCLGADLTDLASAYGISLPALESVAMSTKTPFYLVANAYTMGTYKYKNQSGNHFRIGESYEINFNESMISKDGEVWIVDELEGTDGVWTKLSSGVYKYKPTADVLEDSFVLNISCNGNKAALYGKITVDIAISRYYLYQNVSFDTLKDAIKGYEDLKVTESESLTSASIPKETVESDTKYSFAKTTGCMEVPETGFYTLYLKSSGLCSVNFGVKEYYFEMFNNSLTVSEYTNELSYNIKLEKGFVYYYDIYVLSDQGKGYATLGIKDLDGNLGDVDENYIINSGLRRSEIINYKSPNNNIAAITEQSVVYNIAEIKESSCENATFSIGGSGSSEIVSTIEGILNVTFKQRTDVDYIRLNVENMSGVTLKAYYGSNNELLCTKQLQDGDNFITVSSVYTDKIRLVFSCNSNYYIKINSFDAGTWISEMPIVPSTSTTIEYIGEWHAVHEYVSMNGTIAVSNASGSAISYTFSGDEISVYAVCGPNFGSATIYIDGDKAGTIDFFNSSTKCAQMLYSTKLEDGDHVIEIKANGDTPINLDYFAVSSTGTAKVTNDFSKIWYVIFIPIIIVIGAAVCIILDMEVKKKKNAIPQIVTSPASPANTIIEDKIAEK